MLRKPARWITRIFTHRAERRRSRSAANKPDWRFRPRLNACEDRTVPSTVVYENTFNWQDMATVTATVTEDAPGYEGQYLWNYHVVNDDYMSGEVDIGTFVLDIPDPDAVANLGNSLGWTGTVGQTETQGQFGSYGELPGGPSQVTWQAGEFGSPIGIGQSGDFWFTTLPTEIVASTGYVSDQGFAGQAGGAVAAPIADPFMVTTQFDVVNPADGVISLREAIKYANSRNGFVPPQGFQIRFDPVVFGGAQTISLGSELPACSVKMSILGTGINSLTIAGGGSKGIFTISAGIPVTISNLMLRDGLNTGIGGAIGTGGAIANNGNLTLNSVRIKNSRADMGGAIWTNQALTMTGCEIIECDALGPPRNGADGRGAGILVSLGTATISNSVIRDCVADARGGGIAIIASGQVQLTDSDVLMNRANTGAGIYNSGATLSMTNCSIMDNTATAYGGGIEAGGTTTLDNVTLRHNIANGPNSKGGGLYLVSGDFTMTGGVIEQSSAVNGGAIYVVGGTNTFRQGVIIRDNNAWGWGGVSYSEAGTLDFNACTFSGNQATNGAPLFARKIASQAVVTVTGCNGAGQNDVVNAP